ncbi:uncharacterized protein AB9W97_011944 isoform 2-T2 [Spinachia spinachia]
MLSSALSSGGSETQLSCLRFVTMLARCFLVLLLSLATPLLVAMETCPATGIHGMPGIPGLPGRDGRDGDKGDKGETGAVLHAGLAPQKGETGETGPTGFPGKRGQSGEPGEPGAMGAAGSPGEPGEPGTVDVQRQAAFSVARGTELYPNPSSVIHFTKVITNINEDYNTLTGSFLCRVPGTYYFVYHASLEDRLCVLMKLDETLLASFCDHRRTRR